MRVKQMFATTTAIVLLLAGSAAAQQTAPPPPTPPLPPLPSPVIAPTPVIIPSMPDVRLIVDPIIAPMALALDESRRSLNVVNFQLAELPRLAPVGFDFQDSRFAGLQSDSYISGKELLNQSKYQDAIIRFDRVIAQKSTNADGALYWKSYAQFKLGKSEDALATITQLRRDHGQSAYLADAKVLEADVRRMAGQAPNPSALDDDELKLLALQGLMRTDPEKTIPQIESALRATNSLRYKKNALYLLALSTQPRAREILLSYAKGAGNPDLQLEAIRYLVANRDKQQTTAAQLMQIYQSTQDSQVKMAVLNALKNSGDQTNLIAIASSGQTPIAVRQAAIGNLASANVSPTELWALYEKETNRELKMQLVGVFGSIQAVDQLNRIARTEKDLEVRRSAVRALGRIKTEKTGQMLVDLYGAEQDADTRRVVISSLANQANAEALVAIARKETTLPLKTEIVRKLSDLAPKSKVAADYLMEIIK
jgi:hypothetical protein